MNYYSKETYFKLPKIKILQQHIVPENIENIRLQEYAPLVFNEFIPSKSGIKKAIKNNLFLIDSAVAQTGSWILPGQKIELISDNSIKPKVFEYRLDVIFEDEYFAAIYKPAGITVSGNKFKTIFNALPFNLSESSEPDALFKPTPVHRLDNQTSGILLVAKTKTAQISLGNQFFDKTIQKTYHAIVIGKVEKNNVINTTIDSKKSETHFEVISTTNSLKYTALSFLKVTPKTGRTHQIRIHLSSINHPILGDKLYGNTDFIHKGKGLFLAATEIEFTHPKTMDLIHIKTEIPSKFHSLLTREERRWNNYYL